jgi:hypothetical protein
MASEFDRTRTNAAVAVALCVVFGGLICAYLAITSSA